MAGAFALLMTATLATTTVTVRPALDVAVIVEPDVTVRDPDLAVVADGVRAIWLPAADVRLRRSGDLRSGAGGERIELVLTSRVRRTAGPALGWVDFVQGTPQPLITVSMTEIATLMHAGRWQGRALDTLPGAVGKEFSRRALIFAVAHEIGHYLLRSTSHSKHGLMQAHVAADDILDPTASTLRLSASEIDRVRQRPAPTVALAEVRANREQRTQN
jgi:hypothetical protein